MKKIAYLFFILALFSQCKSGDNSKLDSPTKMMNDTIVAKDGIMAKSKEIDTVKMSVDSLKLDE